MSDELDQVIQACEEYRRKFLEQHAHEPDRHDIWVEATRQAEAEKVRLAEALRDIATDECKHCIKAENAEAALSTIPDNLTVVDKGRLVELERIEKLVYFKKPSFQ